MKKVILLIFLCALASPMMAQSHGKMTADEEARKTPDQRYVYESERKGKKKKNKTLSSKKKMKIQKKEDRRMRRKKTPHRAS
jgi:uncharacterized protein YdeI (BOF family)